MVLGLWSRSEAQKIMNFKVGRRGWSERES